MKARVGKVSDSELSLQFQAFWPDPAKEHVCQVGRRNDTSKESCLHGFVVEQIVKRRHTGPGQFPVKSEESNRTPSDVPGREIAVGARQWDQRVAHTAIEVGLDSLVSP